MTTRMRVAVFLWLVTASACASAGKRVKQGNEARARGAYTEAAYRYIDAMQKDAGVEGAREALGEVWDSVLAGGLRDANEAAGRDDPVGAADAYRALDRVITRAAAVSVHLRTPATYAPDRRQALDRAVASLLETAASQHRSGSWGAAQSTYRRIRADYEPRGDQRQAAIEGEAAVLLDWADSESRAEHFRASFLRASEVLDLGDALPAELVEGAVGLQQRAVARGHRVLAVFPLEATSNVPRSPLPELVARLTDALDGDHWRRPPTFIVVADPASVRQLTRRLSPPGVPLRPGRVLAEVGADFGVLVQVTDVRVRRDELKHREVAARTRQGRPATYRIESGREQYTVTVLVTLFRSDGLEIQHFPAQASRATRFERGVYRGDPRNLDLSRGERRLFDPEVWQGQRGAAVDELVAEVASDVAGGVFQRILSLIP